MILSNIVIYEKNISAENFINKKIETKDKWNQINVLSMEYMLGANFSTPLLNMPKRKFGLKKQINVSMSFLLDICLIQFYTHTQHLDIK